MAFNLKVEIGPAEKPPQMKVTTAPQREAAFGPEAFCPAEKKDRGKTAVFYDGVCFAAPGNYWACSCCSVCPAAGISACGIVAGTSLSSTRS